MDLDEFSNYHCRRHRGCYLSACRNQDDRKIMTGGAEQPSEIYYNLFSQIGQDMAEKDFEPFFEYDEIPASYPYISKRNIAKPNCHLGQRKLLLNELQFYSCYLPHDEPHLVIYAGSASSEHMPIILDHFPNTKFLLIDPNYHNIDLAETRYIYQDPSKVSNENLREFTNYIRFRGDKERLLHLKKGANRLTHIKFLLGKQQTGGQRSKSKRRRSKRRSRSKSRSRRSKSKSRRSKSRSRRSKSRSHRKSPSKSTSTSNEEDSQEYNVIESVHDFKKERSSQELDEILKIRDDFFAKNYRKLVKDIFASKNRVFFIQDYMTQLLSEKIRASLDAYGKKVKVFFVTDIRTTFIEEGAPGDLDVLWNGCLQIIFLKILKPEMSMLKYHPPYFNPKDKEQIDNIWFGAQKEHVKKIMSGDFDWVQEKTGVDYIEDYMNGDFYYFESHTIFLQPWAPKSSSESRLIVSKKGIDQPMVKYDHHEWEDNYFFLNLYRSYAFHSMFIKILKEHQLNFDYDGCFDCSLEMIIIGHMLSGGGPKINVKSIASNMKKDRSLCIRMLKVYHAINKIIFFNLRKNYKCPMHRFIFSPPREIYFYKYVNLYQIPKNQPKFDLIIDIIGADKNGKVRDVDTVTAKVSRQKRKIEIDDIPERALRRYPQIRGAFLGFIDVIGYHRL